MEVQKGAHFGARKGLQNGQEIYSHGNQLQLELISKKLISSPAESSFQIDDFAGDDFISREINSAGS